MHPLRASITLPALLFLYSQLTSSNWRNSKTPNETALKYWCFCLKFQFKPVCPSCNARRMEQTAAHLVDHVFPHLPVRQWVLSVPKRLRYFMQRDGAVLGMARTEQSGSPANWPSTGKRLRQPRLLAAKGVHRK